MNEDPAVERKLQRFGCRKVAQEKEQGNILGRCSGELWQQFKYLYPIFCMFVYVLQLIKPALTQKITQHQLAQLAHFKITPDCLLYSHKWLNQI